jgi:hypothetical protein
MLILVLILTWLAGYLIVAALRPADQPWRGAELAWSLLIGLALTSWLGQLLADLAWFSLPALLGGMLALSGALALRLRGRIAPRGLWPRLSKARLELALLGAALGVGALLFLQPAETPLGGRDDGLRLMAGATVARHGGWIQHAPLLPDLALYRGPQNDLKHIGFLVWDMQRELLVPQFTGAHEVWQAIAYGWPSPETSANLRAAHPLMFYLNPLLAVAALAYAYLLGRELFGRTAALIGALLLAINVAQVWYARQTMAEILLELLLLGGLAAISAYLRAPDRVTALAAGLSFGVALLTKVDTLIALAALGGVALLIWPSRRNWPHLGWLLAPVGLAVAHYVVHSARFSATYFSDNVGNLLADRRLALAIGLGTALLLLALLTLLLLRARRPDWSGALRSRLPRVLPLRWRVATVTALLLLAGYGYFVRPTVLAQESYIHPVWQAQFETYRGLNLVLLAAYLTPLGFALALAGLAACLIRTLRWQHLPFLGVLLGYTLIFTYNAMIAGDQPFWVRRFLPAAIPGALLLAGSALALLWRGRSRWRWSAPALLLALLAWSGWQTAPVAAIRSGAGVGAQVAMFVEQTPPDAVVLFQDWQAGFALAAPLEMLYGRESYELPLPPLQGEAGQQWQRQIERWLDAGRPLIYVATDGRLTLPAEQLAWQPLADQALSYRTLETTHDRLPARPIDLTQRFSLYRITRASAVAPVCGRTVEVGGDDYGAIGAGFYDSETQDAAEVRWSSGAAELVLPALSGSDDLLVTLRLNNPRPAAAGPATLQMSIGGQALDVQPLQSGWQDYELRIPAAALTQPAPALLRIETPTWAPLDYGIQDGRTLGVQIDSFTARRLDCATP